MAERQTKMHSSDRIKILLADDHPILRKTLSNYLSQEAKLQVVGEEGDTNGLIEAVRLSRPDILLLDVTMPGPDVVDVVKVLKNQFPNMQVIILSATKRSDQVEDLLKVGVSGYVLKEDSPSELLEAIDAVVAGDEWFSPQITRVLVNAVRRLEVEARVDLTEREKDVLRLMVTGVNNDEIGAQLVISTNTVRNHVRSIFHKLGVNTRVEAVVYALEHHLVDTAVRGKSTND